MFAAIRKLFFWSLAVGITAGIIFVWWLISPNQITPTSVIIEPGEKFSQVVAKLRDSKVVRSPWLFSKVGVIIGLDRRIIPGRYDFGGRAANYDILRKFGIGDILIARVTIPEGFNLKQIAERLRLTIGLDSHQFDSLARDRQFLSDLGINAPLAEGYLFPDTYRIPWGIPAGDVMAILTKELFTRAGDSLMAKAALRGIDLHELLTMASIIELEALADDELPTMASVYYNRLRIGMPLQADPTVVYAMNGLDRPLMLSDYKFPSPYNTYRQRGLPPTPICSPGMKAILAALNPADTDYLYFVADGRGRHIFNRTYQQHLRDNARIKRELRRAGS